MSVSYTENWIAYAKGNKDAIDKILPAMKSVYENHDFAPYENWGKESILKGVKKNLKEAESYKDGDLVFSISFTACDGDHQTFNPYLDALCAIPDMDVAAYLCVEDNEYGEDDEVYTFWKPKGTITSGWIWELGAVGDGDVPEEADWFPDYLRDKTSINEDL